MAPAQAPEHEQHVLVQAPEQHVSSVMAPEHEQHVPVQAPEQHVSSVKAPEHEQHVPEQELEQHVWVVVEAAAEVPVSAAAPHRQHGWKKPRAA
nr:unnamed protein product [Digitaria exilis]